VTEHTTVERRATVLDLLVRSNNASNDAPADVVPHIDLTVTPSPNEPAAARNPSCFDISTPRLDCEEPALEPTLGQDNDDSTHEVQLPSAGEPLGVQSSTVRTPYQQPFDSGPTTEPTVYGPAHAVNSVTGPSLAAADVDDSVHPAPGVSQITQPDAHPSSRASASSSAAGTST